MTHIRVLVVLALAASLVVLVTCGGEGWSPAPVTPEVLKRGQARYPDLTTEQLGRGREVLVTRCGRCHRLPPPNYRPEAKWPKIIERMGGKAGLTAAERQDLLRYLMSNR